MSGYYTVTMDYDSKTTGHIKAILIQKAENEFKAMENFGLAFGILFIKCANAKPGIHIEPEFQELITDRARKLILKLSSDTPDTPSFFSYSNSICVDYA